MPKISTYIVNAVPTISDMLIGTDVGSYMTNETKNFLISDLIALNTVNPAGPPGATGPQGPQGLTGATGPQGIQGVANLTVGVQGVAGTQGIPGIIGLIGATGATGILGNPGTQGVPGITGLIGATGGVGAIGLQGNQGPTGLMGPASTVVGPTGPAGTIPGPTGLQGIQGIVGLQGIQGITGVNGPQGLNWQGTWSAAGVYVVDDAVEYLGSSYFCYNNVGPIGTNPVLDTAHWAILTMIGTGGPTGSIGPQGVASTVAGPTGIQGLPGATGPIGLQGPIGLTGSQGVIGILGPTGPIGLTGSQGVIGAQGIQGVIGLQGAVGLTGSQGIQGVQGIAGIQGPQGTTGLQGPIGPTGLTGPTGPQGPQGPQGPVGATGATGPTGFYSAFNIGRFYQGGWVAAEWLEGPSNTKKVLIVGEPLPNSNWTLPAYQLTTVPPPGAENRFFGAGNTAAITTQAGVGSYAAADCENLVVDGFTDWYLPSIGELTMVIRSLPMINKSRIASSLSPITMIGLTPFSYWSSTEASASNAYIVSFVGIYTSTVSSSKNGFNPILPVRITSIP